VLAEEESDFASAHTDVAGGNVGVWSDMAREFGHETLAETHHFVIALALRIEIASAFAAAHGQRGERVFEDLFERQEFQNAKVDRGMEAQSTFIRTDGAV